MLLLIDFLRDNLYWILAFIVVIVLAYGKYCINVYRKDVKRRVAGMVDIYEKCYLGRSDVLKAELNNYPLSDIQFYSDVEEELSNNGFVLIGDFVESLNAEISPNSYCFSRAMRNDDGTTTAVFYHYYTVDIKGNIVFNEYRIGVDTTFENEVNISTIPLKYKDEYYRTKNIINEFVEVENVSELLSRHEERVEKYISENPNVEIRPILSFDDLAKSISREREIKRESFLDDKRCLISYSDFQKAASIGKVDKNLNELWIACVEEQKRRGYWNMDGYGIPETIEEPQNDADNIEAGSNVSGNTEDNYVPKDRLSSIAEQVQLAQQKKPNPLNGLITLVVSLFIFFSLGWLKWSLDFVGYIILVLFIHEMGHYLAMRLFGYRNLKMFFIPLLGAAVSGHGHNIPTYKKVIVSLAGPLPGIILGLVLVWYSLAYNNEVYRKLAFLLLFLNGFNLIPFLPLDGGWVMHHTLYSRFPILEVGMRVIAASLFGFIALKSGDFIFFLLAFVNFASIKKVYKDSKFIKQAKQELSVDESDLPEQQSCSLVIIPRQWLGKIADYLSETKKIQAHDTIANEALELWDRINNKPTGIFSTLSLWLLTFIVGWCGLLLGAVASAGYLEPFFIKAEIVQCQADDGTPALKLFEYCYNNPDNIRREIQLSEDGKLYHGTHKYYWQGKLLWEGQWQDGLMTGEWKRHWNGDVDMISIYEQGRLISEKEKDEFGNWQIIEKEAALAGILDDSESEDSGAIADFFDNLEDEDFIFPEGPSSEVLAKWRSKRL